VTKEPKRRLKVFQAQFGFFDAVVAAPSQAAALRAWGTHQNLFANGQASVATDAAAVKAALAHPGETLRRAVGSSDAFALHPASLPKPPKAAKRTEAPKPKAKPQRQTPSRPLPDRSKLDAAEAALRKVDDRRKAEEAALEREADGLEARRTKAQQAYVDARKAASAAVVAARTAYRDAGGSD
jgi:hypothetical protein